MTPVSANDDIDLGLRLAGPVEMGHLFTERRGSTKLGGLLVSDWLRTTFNGPCVHKKLWTDPHTFGIHSKSNTEAIDDSMYGPKGQLSEEGFERHENAICNT